MARLLALAPAAIRSTLWIGIDGYGGNDVCQIGTVQAVTKASDGTLSKSCYAWSEWYPPPWQAVANFPVTPGDTVTGLICVQSPTSAQFSLVNRTTGVRTGFTFNAPAGTTLAGNTAEWIVERPGIDGSTAQLPDFGSVYFDSATANGTSGLSGNPGSGTVLNMVENNTTVATTAVETPTLMRVSYTGS